MSWDMVEKLAESGVGSDEGGFRKEFVSLVKKARALEPAAPASSTP
jgi:Ca-activated chloride channel family protein